MPHLHMQGVHTEKVEGGKLVRVKAGLEEDGSLNEVHVQGDFFIHPEEFVEDIEMFLLNVGQDSNDASIVRGLDQMIEDKRAELVGVNPEAIVRSFRAAVENALQDRQ